MSRSFVYEPTWRVLVCVECGFCLLPTAEAWKRHLRASPHRIFGAELKALVDLFASYNLAGPDEVQLPTDGGPEIAGLRCHDGYRCTLCPSGLTRSPKTARDHASKVHGRKPAEHRQGALWSGCVLQTFFAEPKHVRYFVVRRPEQHEADATEQHEASDLERRTQEDEFFRRQEDEARKTAADAMERGDRVHGFDDHKSAVIPWLRSTGIADHLRHVKKSEIRASIALPGMKDAAPWEYDDVLPVILDAMDGMFREAHSWCFDGPDCMLTWPRQVILSRFQSSQVELVGKTRGFEPYKEASTLARNFGLWKRCLCYTFRVLGSTGGLFSKEKEGQRTPEDAVQATEEQKRYVEDVVRAARSGDDRLLKDGLMRLCMAMICHETHARRYSSPLLSFCAMLSVKPSTRTWKEATNFNSALSGVTWVVQLLTFYHCAREERAGGVEASTSTLTLLKGLCERYLQQTSESPMGEVLRWRLILFKASKEDVGAHQARWDEDEEVLTFGETRLGMDRVPALLRSEYLRACRLLEQELLLDHGGSILPMKAWLLKDRPDIDTFGWYFGRSALNGVLLGRCESVLLRAIRRSERLKAAYLVESTGEGGTRLAWREKAIALYEASADEFLKSLAVLVHMSSGQPLREPEFLSMTWKNTEKRRSVVLEHGLSERK